MSANEKQVGGSHYKTGGEEHWDRVARLKLNYFQARATAYTERAPHKNGKQDIEKAIHFLEKYLEVWDILHPPAPPAPVLASPFVPDFNAEDKAREDYTTEGFRGDMTLFQCKTCKKEAWSKWAVTAVIPHRTICPLYVFNGDPTQELTGP